MTSYYISLVLAFVLMNLLPAAGAYYFARYLNRGGYSELFLLTFSIFFIELIISFGVPGVSGHLNYITCGTAASLIGASLCLFRKHAKPVKSKPLNSAERLFMTLIFAFFLIRFYWASMLHCGTDTYLYHFYYPAMWLTEGRIYPVSIAGLPCEYYPFYGELLYGWLMLPFGDASFAIFLQLLSCVMACSAVIATAKAFGFKRLDGLIAASIMLYSSIIAEVAVLGYTDVVNGSFLLAGFAIMILGALRNNLKYAVAAGIMLGASASIKYTGLLLTPILTFACLLMFIFFRKKLWKYSLLLACSAFISAAPCYVMNFIKTGNPFYPVKIRIAGISIFPAGIDIKHSATGFNRGTWSYFVNHNIWDMNLATGIFYLFLPFAAITLFCLYRKFNKKQMVFPFLACMVIILAAIQIYFYPAAAQARQIIPILMLSSLLIIPLSNVIINRQGFIIQIISISAFIVLCILVSYTVNLSDIIKLWLFAGTLALIITLCPSKVSRYIYGGLAVLLLISLPYLFQARLISRNKFNYVFAGESGGRCAGIIWNDFNNNNRPVKTASVGTWLNYMLMADMPGNQVLYIPINKKNVTHPHVFDSHTELRDNPVPFAEWYKRLKKQNIDYLIIGPADSDFITNKYQELRWAKAHPQYFKKLIEQNGFFMFRVVK